MLGAALVMLAVVSALLAFGAWPGNASGREVDQVLLNEVGKPKPQKVAVSADAVKTVRRTEARRRVALARGNTRGGGRGDSGGGGRTRAGIPTAGDPGGGTTQTGTAGPVAAAPGGDGPASTVRDQTQNVTQTLDQTTQGVGDTVQNQVDQTTTQVNQVVDQVVSGVQQTTDTTTTQVQNTVGDVTDTVTSTTGSLPLP
jgi:hypothetical protein